MKIAISTDSSRVSEHFGRCPEFTIVDIKDDKVINKEVIQNPGHRTGFIPKFLKDRDVDCVIAGGAGFKAKELFNQFDMELIIGVSGTADSVIEDFIKGNLEQGGNFCNPSNGKGYGIKKEDGHE